jgi:AcrR family transcriptional regulator
MRPVAGEPAADRRSLRHEATKAEILGAAWGLARDRGLTGFTLRDLALAVQMRHQSLYTYFPSKQAIYDAMFAQGMRTLVDQRAAMSADPDPIGALRQSARAFLTFCVEDAVRYQLLFERVVPDFVPSAASMERSAEALGYLERWLGNAGLTDLADVDLWRAVLTGLAGQQIANDPGGTRWTKLVDRAIDGMLRTARYPQPKQTHVGQAQHSELSLKEVSPSTRQAPPVEGVKARSRP